MNIQQAFDLAIQYYQSGDLQQAVNICRKIRKIHPNNVNAVNLLGIISYQQKDYDSAIRYAKKLINLNPNIAQTYFILGYSLKEKGEIEEAITYYQKSLQLNPNFVDAYYNLGAIFQDRKRNDEAISCYQKALQLNPNLSSAHYNLGNVFRGKGQLDDAISCYQNALKLDPTFVLAHNNLGNVFRDKGQLDDAISCYQNALKLDPTFVFAHNNLGNVFRDKGQLDDAISCYQNALKLDPTFVLACSNLGVAFRNKGQLDDAISCYQKTLQLNPNFSDAYNNLGAAFQSKGQLDDAISCYQKTLQLNPNLSNAHYNLGNAFQEKGQLDDAVSSYQRAIQLNPNSFAAHNNLGMVFKNKQQFEDAIACFQKSLEINPHFVEAYFNLGNIFYEQGQHEKAIAAYDTALFSKPDFIEARWARCLSHLPIIYPDHSSIQASRTKYRDELMKLQDSVSGLQAIGIAADAVGVTQPFYLAYQGFNDRELQQLYGNMVCQIMASRYPQFADRPPMPSLSPEEPVRVGIVSGWFFNHSNWKIPIRGWIENIDKNRFSLNGYYTGRTKDRETEVARQSFSRFVENIRSFEDFCKTIRQDNLHVLIYPEIGMDPMTVRLASLHLAPVQCSSWGHPDTSGLPTIDYFISGDLIESAEADEHYTEQLVRLPNLSIYYTPREIPSAEVNRNTFGLDRKTILFHCCQYLFKFLPQYDIVFVRIAQEVEDCKFLFSSYPKSSFIIEQFRSRIYRAFSRFNLNAEDHVMFLPYLDTSRYEAINCISDVFLDPIGWSGCNSVLEAINRDLPVVTYPGKLMRGREGSAILTMMGLTEVIPQSVDDYIKIAIRLGRNSEWRKQISEKIAANKHRLYRDRTCITALEDFLEATVRERLNK